MALIEDEAFKSSVEKYAADQKLWFEDFMKAWVKLQEFGTNELRDILWGTTRLILGRAETDCFPRRNAAEIRRFIQAQPLCLTRLTYMRADGHESHFSPCMCLKETLAKRVVFSACWATDWNICSTCQIQALLRNLQSISVHRIHWLIWGTRGRWQTSATWGGFGMIRLRVYWKIWKCDWKTGRIGNEMR